MMLTMGKGKRMWGKRMVVVAWRGCRRASFRLTWCELSGVGGGESLAVVVVRRVSSFGRTPLA